MIKDLQVDHFQNILIAGAFKGVTDFDPGPLTASISATNDYYRAFTLKMTNNGNYRWVKALVNGNGGRKLIALFQLKKVIFYILALLAQIRIFDPGDSVSHD